MWIDNKNLDHMGPGEPRDYWRDNHTKETENIAIEIDREMK